MQCWFASSFLSALEYWIVLDVAPRRVCWERAPPVLTALPHFFMIVDCREVTGNWGIRTRGWHETSVYYCGLGVHCVIITSASMCSRVEVWIVTGHTNWLRPTCRQIKRTTILDASQCISINRILHFLYSCTWLLSHTSSKTGYFLNVTNTTPLLPELDSVPSIPGLTLHPNVSQKQDTSTPFIC